MRERLDQAAKDFWIANRHGAVPSQYALAADYRLMESALRHALKKLLPADRDQRGRVHAAIGIKLADGEVRRRIVSVAELYRATRAACRAKDARPKRGRRERNFGDQALDGLIGDLIGIWADVFGRRPATSIRSRSVDAARDGEPSGTMLAFIAAALQSLLSPVPGAPALRARIREAARLSGLGRTTIYGLLARKAIESTKVGKRRLVRRRAISELGER